MSAVLLYAIVVTSIVPVDRAATKQTCSSPDSVRIVRPGEISGSHLRPYVRHAQQIITDANGRVINARPLWRDELSTVSGSNRPLMRRIWQLVAFNGSVHAVDSVLFDAATLEPVYNSEWVQGTVAWQRKYDGNRVTGQKLAAQAGTTGTGAKLGDPSVKLDVTLAERVFDFFGGMDGIIASAIDLTTGARTRIPVYDPNTNSVRLLELRVAGEESVEAGRGKLVQASVVVFDGLNGPMKLWVSRQPPYTYKSEETLLRDGKPWRIITSLMVVS